MKITLHLPTVLLSLVLATLFAGCSRPVDSTNPLYTDKDGGFDQALLGQWLLDGGSLTFVKADSNEYQAILSGGDENQTTTVVFDVHLINLAGHYFLDVVCQQSLAVPESEAVQEVHLSQTKNGLKITPALVSAGPCAFLELRPADPDGDEVQFTMHPRQAHDFFKVVIEDEGKTLRLSHLDKGWVSQQIEDGKLVIDHEIVDGSIVLTASTADLRQLVFDHENDEEAFSEELIVRRPIPE